MQISFPSINSVSVVNKLWGRPTPKKTVPKSRQELVAVAKVTHPDSRQFQAIQHALLSKGPSFYVDESTGQKYSLQKPEERLLGGARHRDIFETKRFEPGQEFYCEPGMNCRKVFLRTADSVHVTFIFNRGLVDQRVVHDGPMTGEQKWYGGSHSSLFLKNTTNQPVHIWVHVETEDGGCVVS